MSSAKGSGNAVGNSDGYSFARGPPITALEAYNGTAGWVPLGHEIRTIHTDTPKFRGQSDGIASVHVTLNGTKVGGSNVRDDGGFNKGWKHAPLNQSGMYVLEIRETATAPLIALVDIEIIVPGAPAAEEPSAVVGAVEEEQPPQQQQQQQPPPPPPPPQQQQQSPPTPTKSANVTLVHDGSAWIQFEDGMTVPTQAPKFRGQTENLESVHITLNGTKVGGSKVSDTGSFWKSWKHDPLAGGAYLLEIRESSDSAVLWSATIRIAG